MLSSDLRDFLNWIHGRDNIAFTYKCNSADFVNNIIIRINLLDIKTKESIEINCPIKKKENQNFLRTIRKCLFELDSKTIIGYAIKDFLNFIPGKFQSKAEIFDLQLLKSLKHSIQEDFTKINLNNILSIFKSFVSDLSEIRQKLYSEILVPSIFFYSEIEKNGLPTSSGRLYSYYNMDGTVSGRLTNSSFDNPKFINPLNIAKDQRKIIVAPKDFSFICADYNAMEIRILGYISQDENLNNIFNSNQDVYEWIGKKIFKLNDIDYEQRKFVKDLCFHIVYGGTEFGFSKQQNCSLEEARGIIAKFFSLFPTLEEWIINTQINIIEQQFVESKFGRIRPLDFSDQNRAIRQGQNFLIQSLANDIMTSVVLELQNELLEDSRIIIHVFDSIVVMSPEEKINGNTNIITRVMKNPLKIKYFGINNLCLDPVLDFSNYWR